MEMNHFPHSSLDLSTFESVEQITNNHRYATYKVLESGDYYFLKIPVEERLKERLAIEEEGMNVFAKHDPNETLYKVPILFTRTDDYIKTEFINGKVMSQDFTDMNSMKIQDHMSFLIDLYAFTDGFSEGTIGNTRFNIAGQKPKTTQTLEKLGELSAKEYFDIDLARNLGAYIDRVAPSLKTRYSHGDLQPGNIMKCLDGTYAILDFETCAQEWPRHYNIVNFTFNYLLAYPELHQRICEVFWRYCMKVGIDPIQNIDAFNASAAMRVIQMMVEKMLDSERAKELVSDQTVAYIHESGEKILSGKLFIKN